MLVSFAVPKGPSLNPADKRLAVHVEDHPAEYADFEGVIPADNYGAGPSLVWDKGAWVNIEGEKHGLGHGKLLFDLHGHKLRGRWTLVKIKGTPKEWLLIKKPDAYAKASHREADELGAASVLSGLTIETLAKKDDLRQVVARELETAKVPKRAVRAKAVELMLAETAASPFDRDGWLFELKYDGFRLLAERREGKAFLRYRRGSDVTERFPELALAVASLPYDVVLDLEMVVLDAAGRPSFSRLQKRVQLTAKADVERAQIASPVVGFVFDLLSLEGHDLRGLPLTERKDWLRRVLPSIGPLRFADHVETTGAALFREARKLGLEGVMGKRMDAPYRAGRRGEWLKVRGELTGDFAVVGYTLPQGQRTGFGALDLAAWDGDELRCVGSVGTGFSDALLDELGTTLEKTRRVTPAFVGKPVPGRKHVWVEPTLVVEVAYHQRSTDGMLRHPKFLRLRDDKRVEDCEMPPSGPHDDWPPPDARESASDASTFVAPSPSRARTSKKATFATEDERRVVISNPKKVFWPADGFTKTDLVDYYRSISPWLLPYLAERPVVLTRYPDGIDGKSFFQKDAPVFVPEWLRRVRIWSEQTQRDIDYFVCDDVQALAYVANLATIPLHVWSSRQESLQTPDWSILDLDPKGAPFADVVKVALEVRRICDAIELPSFVKTSGSSGLHILFPMGRGTTYEASRGFAELLARVVVTRLPEISTIERVIAARGGRVYLDYLQNGHGKLLVSPFSVRPLPGAPVSMPLAWKEVGKKLTPTQFDIRNAVARMEKLGSDPNVGILETAIDLKAVLERLSAYLRASARR